MKKVRHQFPSQHSRISAKLTFPGEFPPVFGRISHEFRTNFGESIPSFGEFRRISANFGEFRRIPIWPASEPDTIRPISANFGQFRRMSAKPYELGRISHEFRTNFVRIVLRLRADFVRISYEIRRIAGPPDRFGQFRRISAKRMKSWIPIRRISANFCEFRRISSNSCEMCKNTPECILNPDGFRTNFIRISYEFRPNRNSALSGFGRISHEFRTNFGRMSTKVRDCTRIGGDAQAEKIDRISYEFRTNFGQPR